MTFPADAVADVEEMHRDWARDDITIKRRTLTDISVTGSTPTYGEVPAVITGVFTETDTALMASVFGGLENCDAMLLLLPAVLIAYEDVIEVDARTFRVEEIRNEDMQGTGNQKFCRLKKIS